MSTKRMSTKERLAQVLHAAGLFEMEGRARLGEYDDFESNSATPITRLILDLQGCGHYDLAKRTMNGEFDSTKEEAEAWMQREGKNLLP